LLTADYHTHTVHSHGKGTLEENVQAAIALGLRTIAVSEHNGGHLLYGVRGKNLAALRAEAEAARVRYGDQIEVLLGVEANLLGDGITDLPPNAAELFRPLLLGYHKGVWPRGKAGWRWTAGLLFGQSAKDAERNAMSYAHAMERHPGLFAITHPGLYIPVDHKTLAKACADNGVLYELNGGHSGLTAENLAAAASVSGVGFLLSSDAHAPARVGNVESALAIAKEVGVLDRIVNYEAK